MVREKETLVGEEQLIVMNGLPQVGGPDPSVGIVA